MNRDLWRGYLPDPERYFKCAFSNLTATHGGWHTCLCPFHEDRHASFSVNLGHGGWKCHAGCGTGDLIAFHAKKHGLSFKDAVEELTGIRP